VSASNGNGGAFWPVFGLLVLGVALLAIRSAQTVESVLAASRRPAAASIAPAPASMGTGLLATRDSLLAESRRGPRDPFRPPPPPPRTPERRRPPAEPTPVRPEMRALLFDKVEPSVQLRVGAAESGWLHQGDSFQGWTVVAITASSVELHSGKQTVVLP